MLRRATSGDRSRATSGNRFRATSGNRLRAAWAALFVVAGVLGGGCFGGRELELPNGAECTFESFDNNGDEPVCKGRICLFLIDNAQRIEGMCSQGCSTDGDCTPHEGCEDPGDGSGSVCLRRCKTDDDCYDRFVCRLLAIGNPRRYCLVDPI